MKSPAATASPAPTASPVPAATKLVYIADESAGVLAFPLTASGNVAPVFTISGGEPFDIAFDAAGRMYVVDFSDNPSARTGDVRIYTPPLSSSSQPTATLTYSGFEALEGVAVDAAGYIYVGDIDANEIYVFSPLASGNATPLRTIAAVGRHISLLGSTIYSPANNAIDEIPSSASGTTNPPALTGSSTQLADATGVSLDETGNIVVHDWNSEMNESVTVYPAGATGNIAPANAFKLEGLEMNEQSYGICVGSQTIVLPAANYNATSQTITPLIAFYPEASSGDATPRSTVSGNLTGLEDPEGCAVH